MTLQDYVKEFLTTYLNEDIDIVDKVKMLDEIFCRVQNDSNITPNQFEIFMSLSNDIEDVIFDIEATQNGYEPYEK